MINPNGPEASRDIHNYDDLDQLPQSHHHTLGDGPTQAAPGNHSHPGGGSIEGDTPTFIQDSAPTYSDGPYAWWETTGADLTLWIEDGV